MKRFLYLLLPLLIVACNDAPDIVTPQLRVLSVSPNQITAGQKGLDVEIVGSGFNSVSSVSFGIDVTVKSFAATDSTRVRAIIDVNPLASAGSRPVSVFTPTGSAQLDSGLQILDNKKPSAAFTVEPASGTQGTVFTFDGRSSTDPDGRIKSYLWEFPDGTTSTKAVAKHSFPQIGTHGVTLTVRDDASQEDVAKNSVRVVFDINVARQQIDTVCKDFLRLFGQLETLTAEEIVVGFAAKAGCTGRNHEISIILRHQSEGGFVDVDVFPPSRIPYVDQQTASAELAARFSGRHDDGSSFNGVVTHYFEMINEPDGWKICNFRAN